MHHHIDSLYEHELLDLPEISRTYLVEVHSARKVGSVERCSVFYRLLLLIDQSRYISYPGTARL